MITIQMRERWGSYVVDGWRCLICGENIDAVIKSNRTRPAPLDQSRARVLGSSPTANVGPRKVQYEGAHSFPVRGMNIVDRRATEMQRMPEACGHCPKRAGATRKN